jgi:hypothetical protein
LQLEHLNGGLRGKWQALGNVIARKTLILLHPAEIPDLVAQKAIIGFKLLYLSSKLSFLHSRLTQSSAHCHNDAAVWGIVAFQAIKNLPCSACMRIVAFGATKWRIERKVAGFG